MGKTINAPALPAATGDARPSGELEHLSTILGRVVACALTAAMRDPEMRAELSTFFREVKPSSERSNGLLTMQQLAGAFNVSRAHIRRLDPPATIVGDATTRRYDLATVRAWLADRTPKPTTPKPAMRRADVDVDAELARAGLRLVGGAR